MGKGQSAVEYLVIYGWMLLVIAVAGGSIFALVSESSDSDQVSGLGNADLRIEQYGISEEGFKMEIRSSGREKFKNVNITLVSEDEGKTAFASKEVSLPAGESKSIVFPAVIDSETTENYKVDISYDEEYLKGLNLEAELVADIKINESYSYSDDNLLSASSEGVPISGGSITAMATSSTFINSSEVICAGGECGNTTGTETDENVSLSGDRMTGTLFVNNITDLGSTCFGELCSFESGSESGYLGINSTEMNGTLNITEIKPFNESRICVGTKC